eukprot:5394394-Prymnesium_polylepis.1
MGQAHIPACAPPGHSARCGTTIVEWQGFPQRFQWFSRLLSSTRKSVEEDTALMLVRSWELMGLGGDGG